MTITVWPADAVAGAPIYSGRKLRQTNAVSLAGATAARPLGARSGVRPGTSTTTVTATATVWTVKPHAGVLDLEAAAEAGPYCYSTDANVTGAVTAASVVRTDLVWVRLDDPAEGDGSATPAVVFGYTAGSSVTPPATPARAMVLAWINVPASGGGVPTVTWKAPILAAGIVPGTTAAAFGSGAFIGQFIDDPAVGLLRWDGLAWRTVTPAPSPAGTLTASSGVISGTAAPAGTVLQTQTIVGTYASGGAGRWLVTYPQAFPNGLVSAQVSLLNGDVYGAWLNFYGSPALASCTVQVLASSGVVPSINPKICLELKGW